MSIKQISIEGNTLCIELGEAEGMIIAKTMTLVNPILNMILSTFCRLVLVMSSLGKDKAMEVRERLSQGEDIFSVCGAMGINASDFAKQAVEDVEWPNNEEIDEMLGWLK
jgi:hypothetical protein